MSDRERTTQQATPRVPAEDHLPHTPFLCLLVIAVVLTSCGSGPANIPAKDAQTANPHQTRVSTAGDWTDSVLVSMSLEEKIGQMVMVSAPTVFLNDSSFEARRLELLVQEYGVGGVMMTHGTVLGASAMANHLQSLARVPLLVASDLERGLAMRFARGTDLPVAMAFGAAGNPELAYEAGRITAREARAVGVNMNFAPVADVNTNPDNPVINTRSYGSDPMLVSTMVAAFVRGTNDGGVLSTVKHFPGHGSTGEDSHLVLPIVTRDWRTLDSIDLAPFRAAIASGCDAVMVGHLAVPILDPSDRPASLSQAIVTGVLREAMHFDGMIITDAMSMGGARVVAPDRAAVMAVEAGADIVLLTADEFVVLRALRDAVRDGELRMARIDSSVRRILHAKDRIGLLRRHPTSAGGAGVVVAEPSHWALARSVARRAVTLLKNEDSLLPLQPTRRKVVSVMITGTDDSRSEVNRPGSLAFDEPTGAYFAQVLRHRHLDLSSVRISPSSSTDELEKSLAQLRGADVGVISLFPGVHTSSRGTIAPERFAAFVRKANALRTPLVLVSLGDPYAITGWPAAKAIVCAYGDDEPEVEAVASCLTGDEPIRGRLPVSLSPQYPVGFGIPLDDRGFEVGDTLRRIAPPPTFASVDSLMTQAVRDSVFPGAQLLVLQGNTVAYARCFGRFTYDPRAPLVDDSTMYDLASLTKVVATTTAVMRLSDRGVIDLDAPVARYLQQFETPERRAITVRQLLLHRSGFPAFRRLWMLAKSPTAARDSVFATPLVAPPGDTTIYSDFNMITLGAIVEHVARVPLDVYVRDAIVHPLGMMQTCFTPAPALQRHAAPTELDTLWRKRLVAGTVHDENAWLLGGVSGHAGLFSTASDLARFALMMMNRGRAYGHEIFSSTTYNRFVGDAAGGGDRWLGWDKRSLEGSSSGTLLSDQSFGHTGFTGTSLWIDPVRHLAVILLTNRIYPSRDNLKILHFRPILHDAVFRALF